MAGADGLLATTGDHIFGQAYISLPTAVVLLRTSRAAAIVCSKAAWSSAQLPIERLAANTAAKTPAEKRWMLMFDGSLYALSG